MNNLLYAFLMLVMIYFAIDDGKEALIYAMQNQFWRFCINFIFMMFWIFLAQGIYQEWNP